MTLLRSTMSTICSGTALLFAACGGGSSGPVDGHAAMEHVRYLVEEIGPRPFGSDNLGKAADYFSQQVAALGLKMERHEVMDERENKLIRNLYCKIPGRDPDNGPILMVGAHYDTKLTEGHDDEDHNFPFVGAIDGGGAPAVLLELARVFLEREPKPEVNIWLYWIDAEESIDFHWNTERALIGSNAFCKWLAEENLIRRIGAFVLLDLIGDKNLKIDYDGKSNKQLQEIIAEAGKQMPEPERVYKYKSATTDDHETFIKYGVPSVLLIDFHLRVPEHLTKEMGGTPRDNPDGYAQWWHTPEDTLDKMSPESLAYAGNLVMAAFDDLEQFVLRRKKSLR